MNDVVIVGGGIAGSSLAVLLARGGLEVTVLERSLQFPDRVRGETMPPWGYLELEATACSRSSCARKEPSPSATSRTGTS
jgi:2-polyprenyl-6-methoxyphenol hydroxylase-like FAD-dependent oxidoreductase